MTESAETTSTATASCMPAWTSESQIDPSWIRQKLTGFERVAECVVDDISNDTRKGDVPRDGATLLLRLASEGEDDAGTTTLVAKQVPPSGLALSRRLGLAREAIFYDRLAPKIRLSSSSSASSSSPISNTSDEACIPKIYYSHGDMNSGSKFVVMEDLCEGYIDSGMLFGSGNPNNWKRDLKRRIGEAYPGGAPTSFEVADRTFSTIANVHAAFWRDEELLEGGSGWLRGAGWVRGEDEASWRASMSMIQTAWEKYASRGGAGENIRWDPLVRRIVEKAMRGISWESQKERLNAETHYCLVHGDFWPGNVMISTDHNADAKNADERYLRLLDWEMVGVGSGPQELGQYVISNMDPAERRECEEQLVRNYHRKLQEQGGNVAWEKCWSEYKIGGLERWLWFLVYFCGMEGMKDWAQYFHDQMKEFVHDHGIQPGDVTQPRP